MCLSTIEPCVFVFPPVFDLSLVPSADGSYQTFEYCSALHTQSVNYNVSNYHGYWYILNARKYQHVTVLILVEISVLSSMPEAVINFEKIMYKVFFYQPSLLNC